jgi:hypothetical protein
MSDLDLTPIDSPLVFKDLDLLPEIFASRKCPPRITRRFLLLVSIFICAVLPSCALLNLGLMKLKFGCIPEGVCIDTPSGPVRIEDLKAGDTVTGYNGSPVCIDQIHQYREEPASSRYVTVSFSNGATVCVSSLHRISGTPASKLHVGDVCGSEIVSAVGEKHGVSRSFDLLTEDPGYRIGGIPVNSMIQEMLNR